MGPAARDAHLDHLIADQFFDIAFVIRADGVVTWRRESSRQPLGIGDGEVEGELILRRVHPEDLPRALHGLEHLAANPGQRIGMNLRIRSLDDPETWLAATGVAIGLHDDPLVEGVLVCVRIAQASDVDLGDAERDGFSLAAAAPVGLGLVAASDRLVWTNAAFASMTGLAPDALERPPPGAAVLVAEIARLLGMSRAGHPATSTVGVGERTVRLRARLLDPAVDGVARAAEGDVLLSSEDVTTEVATAAARAEVEATFRAAFAHSQAGIAVVSLDGRFLRLNPAWAAITGYDEDELRGVTFAAITHPDDLATDEAYVQDLLEGRRDAYRMEKRYLHRAGGIVWVDLRVALVRDAEATPVHFVANITDISERKGVEDGLRADNETLTHRATHDHLTGLPNRLLLEEHLKVAAARVRRTAGTTCVLAADLDRFKIVNDTYGHATGDAALVEIAHRLRAVCREGDIVARVGGDEFVIVADAFDYPLMALRLADRLVAAVERPIDIGSGVSVAVGISIGIAALRPGIAPEATLARADATAYQVKNRGGGHALADADDPRFVTTAPPPPERRRVDS